MKIWQKSMAKLGNLALFGGALLLSSAALALTPVDTEIRNQSTATYTDGGGNARSTTSNEVITVVDSVYDLAVTPNTTPGSEAPGDFSETAALTQSAAPGSTVYYSYYLTNNGNAPDTFLLSRVNGVDATDDDDDPAANSSKIYYDANGNGQVDPGDTLLTAGTVANGLANWGGTATRVVQPDETISLILAYEVPTDATDADTISVDIDAQSQGNTSKTDAVSNYSTTTVTDTAGVLTVDKAVNKTEAAQGETLTYTISGSNTGAAPVQGKDLGAVLIDVDGDGATEQRSGVLITDALSVDLDPGSVAADGNLPGGISAVSSAPNGATVLYRVGASEWVAQAALTTTDTVDGIALYIPDDSPTDTVSDDALAVGQGYSLQFTIAIDADLDDTTIINNATGAYNDGTTDQETDSNDVLTRIGGAPGTQKTDVVIGPFGDPAAATTGETSGPTGGAGYDHEHDIIDDPMTTQVETLTSGPADVLVTVGDRHAGQAVYFVNTVRNDGGGTDVFDITASNAAGYTVGLYKSDGVTPLGDTDGDGIPDTGTLGVDETYDVVVKVTIPGDLAAAVTDNDTTVTATSSNDPTVSDTTIDRISSIVLASVDVALSAADGSPGDYTGDGVPADDPAAQGPTCPTPDVFDFAIDVENIFPDKTETGAQDTYDLTIGSPTAGWTYQIYQDSNADGILDNDELNEITDTGDLNPNESLGLIVRITPPAGVLAGTYSPQLVATSSLDPDVSDSVTMQIDIGNCPAISIVPDNNRTSVAGGVVRYRHVVTNLGNTTEQWDLSFTSSAGYNAVFVAADGTTFGTTATIGDGLNYPATNDATTNFLDPGESVEVFLKVFVPADAPVGSIDIATVTVEDNATGGVTDTAVDTTTVIDGNLELTKEVDATTAAPTRTSAAGAGEFHPLTYTTTYENLGATELEDVFIVDAIPSNTRIVVEDNGADDVDAPTGGTAIQYSTDGGITWGAAPAAEADHSAPTVTNIRWTIGTVASGATGSVTFQVLID